MDVVIAVAASLWFAAFLILEHRVGGRAGYAWRLVGVIPFFVLGVLTLADRFSSDAFVVILLAIVVATSVEPVVRWGRRRAASRKQLG